MSTSHRPKLSYAILHPSFPYDYVRTRYVRFFVISLSLFLPFVFIEPRGSRVPTRWKYSGCKGAVFDPSSTTTTTTTCSSSRFSTGRTSLGPEPAYSFQKLAPDLRGQLFNQFHPLSGRYRHHIGHSRYGTADDDSGGRGQLKSL